MSAEPTGFRRDIMVLRDLSELMEKHPAITRRPTVEFGRAWKEDIPMIRWHLSVDYNLSAGWDYDDNRARTEELRRVDLEERVATILDAFGPGVQWEGNDPNKDTYYYRLTGHWNGAEVEISTTREDVCQKVEIVLGEHEEEQPDPELHQTFLDAVPKVKVMVKDTVTEWQCNTALAAKIHGTEVAA